jgi:hypothetical protein
MTKEVKTCGPDDTLDRASHVDINIFVLKFQEYGRSILELRS